MKPVHPKGNQSWIFFRRTDFEVETPILWPPDTKNWIIGKDPEAGKDWRWEEKGTTEDEMVEWHHRLSRHEFERAPGVGDRQGSLACYSPRGHKVSNTTEQLNWLTTSLYNCDLVNVYQVHKGEKGVNFSVCQLIWYRNSHHSKFQAKNMSPNTKLEIWGIKSFYSISIKHICRCTWPQRHK